MHLKHHAKLVDAAMALFRVCLEKANATAINGEMELLHVLPALAT